MNRKFVLLFSTAALVAASLPGLAANNAPGVPVSVLVTVESKGINPPTLAKEEIRVQENKQVRPITNLRKLDAVKSQLLLLIDDSAGGSFDTQIQEVKNFVTSLPADTEIAIGYMHNGTAQMTSEFTNDHQKAAESIRLPEGAGGADVSPYDSLSDSLKKWPKAEGVDRREVVMISSGIEGLGGGLGSDNPYVNAGIRDAQKAGVVVYAIYNPSFGHAGHSLWRQTWGQNFLSQLADGTGGELYTTGFGSSVSFEPYLTDILKRQNEQYILTFEAEAEKKGGLQPIKVSSMTKSLSVAAPEEVYVKPSL